MDIYQRIDPPHFPIYQNEVDCSEKEENYRKILDLTEACDNSLQYRGGWHDPEERTIDGVKTWVSWCDIYDFTETQKTHVLEENRYEAFLTIDQKAGAARRAIASGGPYQEAEYQEKARQAVAFLADTTLTETDVPMIFANVGTSDGDTASDVANLYDIRANEWYAALARISGIRRRAKDAVAAASTAVDVRDAIGTLDFTV